MLKLILELNNDKKVVPINKVFEIKILELLYHKKHKECLAKLLQVLFSLFPFVKSELLDMLVINHFFLSKLTLPIYATLLPLLTWARLLHGYAIEF